MSILSVFIEGLLSFFSPCVLPLIPVYIGYLSGGTLKKAEDGTMTYDRKKVIVNTIFFVIGISMAFFVLGFGISAVGRFFSGNQIIFARVGGIIVVLFGLYQLGFLGSNRILSGDYRIPVQFEKMTMSPVTAILMGFVISFAWTPCIGPVLSSVLIMAATAGSAASGFGLIAVYTLGYIIPFILVGFFTNTLLEFFSKHKNVVKYTVKIGGVILVVMGLLMFTGKMNSITSYLSTFSAGDVATESAVEKSVDTDIAEKQVEEEPVEEASEESDAEKVAAYDFTLTDQYGNSHTLSDYKGKIVFLNFWATWCPPCRAELPDIQSLYEDYQKMEDPDVIILGVAFPDYGREKSVEEITQFLEEQGVTYPVLMDTEASLMLQYYITAYPTTFIIDSKGDILGYVPGGMTKDIMENIINQAKSSLKKESPSSDFYAEEFDENSDIFARIKGKSYKDNCTVPISDLRYLHVMHIGFDGQPHEGEIICNKYIAEDLLEIFEALYEAQYPIEKIKLVDEYNADDESSMADNNSSSFNFRFISYTTKISKHGYGLAMDINTLYNPYVKTVDGQLSIEPANAAAYVDRSQDFPHKIDENDLAYKLFTEHGFEWGGAWKKSKDYQHFEVSDSVVKKLYN